MSFLVPLLVLAGFALYLMKPDERVRLGQAVLRAVGRLTHAALEQGAGDREFHEALRARTRFAVVTPAIVFTSVVTFVGMVLDAGPVGEPATLIAWGGNFAPRTTNGEWWRIVASTFVHSGALHLIVTMIGLLPAGLVLERLVGPAAFLTVYLAAGAFSGMVTLSESALAVGVGASGGVFGVYGLLLSSALWGLVSRVAMPVPVMTAKRIAAAAFACVAYNALTSDVSLAGEVAGLATGVAAGLLVNRGVAREKPPARRLAIAWVAALLIATGWAVPLRGVTDVRPALERVLAFESRTSAAYGQKVAEFKKGWISAEALAAAIESDILPELQAAHARLKAVRGVPREHLPLLEAADEYFVRRDESWRRRAAGLVQSDLDLLRQADASEREALTAFRRIVPPSPA
jgi:rhomboid protease GluP